MSIFLGIGFLAICYFKGYKILNMNQGIVPADKGLRKKIVLFLVLVTIVFIIIEPYFQGYLDQIDQKSQKDREFAFREMMLLFKLSMGIVSLLLLSMGGYLLLLARGISKSGRYPPPGMKVIRDTRVRTGDKAKSITILMIVSSGILILFAFLFLYFPWAFEKVFQKKRGPEIKPNTGIERKVFTK